MDDEQLPVGLDPSGLSVLAGRLREAREELTRADGKVSMLLASVAVVMSVLIGNLLAAGWTILELKGISVFFWLLGVIGLAGGVLTLAAGVYPSTKRKVDDSSKATPGAFFGDYEGSDVSLLISAEALSPQNEMLRVADQLSQISRIVSKKYRAIKIGMWLLAGGSTFLVLCSLASVDWARSAP